MDINDHLVLPMFFRRVINIDDLPWVISIRHADTGFDVGHHRIGFSLFPILFRGQSKKDFHKGLADFHD